MSNIQQDVMIYRNKAFSTAQSQFEKDLRMRQDQGWRLISITPTRQGFLTAIYERETALDTNTSLNNDDDDEQNIFDDDGDNDDDDDDEQNGAWSRIKEAGRRAVEKERAYQSTLNPEQLRKHKRKNLLIASIALFVVFVLCITAAQATNSAMQASINETLTPTPTNHSPVLTPTPTQKPSPTATPSPTPIPYAHFSDGTFVVGKDIQPGTYRTREGSPGCYFERLSGFGGTLDDIIANDNTDDPAIVTISGSDKGFHSNNCGTWTKDLSAITTSNTSFSNGMYIVGTDIKPGTYKSSGQSGCYYARLSGFGGTLDDIITNNNTDNSAIVTISASDKGFQSNNCGTWTKI